MMERLAVARQGHESYEGSLAAISLDIMSGCCHTNKYGPLLLQNLPLFSHFTMDV